MTLKLSITREVDPKEVAYMIFGTGMFSWGDWWRGGRMYRYAEDGKSIEMVDHPLDDDTVYADTDFYVLRVDDPDEPEGSGKAIKVQLTAGQIVEAAGKALAGDIVRLDEESARDMRTDDLGLADAIAADAVMQVAVFGKLVYG
jgi:hypothetical protein